VREEIVSMAWAGSRISREVPLMTALRTQALVAVVLGVLSLVALGFSHLALTDIAHGEPDVAGEWLVVQVSALIFAVFTVVALVTLLRVVRSRA
jgi:hypothetical protein